MDGTTIKYGVYLAIGLVLLFILSSALIFPLFRNSYEYGFGTTPCNRDGCTSATGLINPNCATGSATPLTCTSCNVSAGYSFFLSNCYSLITWTNDTHCYQCTAFNSYKATNQGLLLLVLVIGLVFFAVTFIKYLKK